MDKKKNFVFLSLLLIFSMTFCGCGTSESTSSNLPKSTAKAASTVSTTQPTPSPVSSASTTTVKDQSFNAKLAVHYIDIGQGDSEFIELPNGQTMLIDAGNPENGADIVSYIKGLGCNKIDYLIATHPHSDHIGGMTDVVNSLNIGKIYMPKVEQTTKVFENLLLAIQNKGLKVNTAKAGINLLNNQNLKIDMLAPVDTSYSNLNNYSAVIKITYGSNSFLFMGDAQTLSEGQITANVKADVLKVGHHGSNTATSNSFLKKVSPKYAVISVGKGNSYGHPATETLDKLKNAGVSIYRTDESGTIIITSDGKNISVNKKASSIKENAPPITTENSNSISSSSSTTTNSVSTDNQNVTVYITNSGKKYHRDGCSSLSKSKIAITLGKAKAEGYTPCLKCDPPQ